MEIIQLAREYGWIVPAVLATPTIWRKYGKPSVLWFFNWLMRNSKFEERLTGHIANTAVHKEAEDEAVV